MACSTDVVLYVVPCLITYLKYLKFIVYIIYMSHDDLIENVKVWLSIDNDIKLLQKEIKNKRKE